MKCKMETFAISDSMCKDKMEKNISERINELESIIRINNEELKKIGLIKEEQEEKHNKNISEEISKIKREYFDKALPIIKSTEIARKKLRTLQIERETSAIVDANIIAIVLTELLIKMENAPYEIIRKKSRISIFSMDTEPEIEYPIIESIQRKNQNEPLTISIYNFDGMNKVFKNMPSYCHDYLERIMLFQHTTKMSISLPEARSIMTSYVNEITAKPYYINMD